jgi:NAD(P)-dependent dehydrogenase (short-subunit alcohol dehydrogenase family)
MAHDQQTVEGALGKTPGQTNKMTPEIAAQYSEGTKEKFKDMTVQMTQNIPSLQQIVDLNGQIAIVTGGCSGLGYNITNRLGEAGATVVIADKDEEYAIKAVKEFTEKGFKVDFHKLDLLKVDDCYATVDWTVKKYGKLDILVNNAAVWHTLPFLDNTEKWYDYIVDTDQKAYYFMGQAAAKAMLKNDGPTRGRIVNIASTACISVESTLGLSSAYTAAKAGIKGLTMAMGRELSQYGIRVNCVAPGAMPTRSNYCSVFEPIKAGEFDEKIFELLKKYDSDIPMCATPDQVAIVAFILTTYAADFMVGQTIIVDGGAMFHMPKEKVRTLANE